MTLSRFESSYIYDLDVVTASIQLLRSQLPQDSTLLYSLKANPHPHVVEHVANQGTGLEVSSEGELQIATTAVSHRERPVEIVCTGPGKTNAYLQLAADAHAIVSIESSTELSQLRRLKLSGLDILVRINASATTQRSGLQMTGTPSPFGVDEEKAEHLIREVVDHGHNFRGVHLYMGSNILSEDDLINQFQISTRIAARYLDHSSGDFIADLGGGFGHPFAGPGPTPSWPGLQERLEDVTEPLKARHAQLAFESGRYLVGSCGSLQATVLDIKESKGQRFVVLSSGVNHLGGLTGLRRLPQAQVTSAQSHNADDSERLVGPLCTPVDVLSKKSHTQLTVGDIIVIPNVGAYGLTASLGNFLSHPYPPEVIRLGGQTIVTTQTQVTHQELIPA